MKIWFCSHPDDKDKYFDRISRDVLKARADFDFYKNCALWFDTEPAADYDKDKLLDDLAEMKLLILPVTKNFLYTDNRARLVELKYAADNHIAILPLMQEPGLEKDFNEICGNIQFLDPNNADTTAISYESKLCDFLSSIIIGDKLIKRIRNEFDARIFLSYRKKDRKFAQELMHIIHGNDLFRDVAIWYDEFLTPGEDFNHSIEDSLAGSDAFVLTVTPSVIEKTIDEHGILRDNYIVTTEYPMANGELPIIPVEMVPTDRAVLCEKYDAIPAPIPSEDGGLLSSALARALSGKALAKKRGNPEHDYLIGLAYLTGTDVEIDRERALSLIIGSAEEGYIEAMSKLSTLYSQGNSVEADYGKAVEWQKKAVEWAKERFRQENVPLVARAKRKIFANETVILSNLYLLGEMSQESEQTLNSLIDFYNTDEGTDDEERCTSVCYLCIKQGDGRLRNKDYQDSDKYYLRALDVAKAFVQKQETKLSLCLLAKIYLKLGQSSDLYKDSSRERSEHEAEYLRLAYAAVKKAAVFPDAAKRDLEIFILPFSVAELHYECACKCALAEKRLENFYMAEQYYKEAESVAALLAAGNHSDEYTSYLIECRSTLMEFKLSQNDLEGAEVYYHSTLRALGKASDDLKTIKSKTWMRKLYSRLGKYLEKTGDYEGAERYYTEVLGYAQELLKSDRKLEDLFDVIFAHNDIGGVKEIAGDRAGAFEHYAKAIEIFNSSDIVGKNDTYYLHGAAIMGSYIKLGGLYLDEKNYDEAEKCFLQALFFAGKFGNEQKQSCFGFSISILKVLAVIYIEKGNILLAEEYTVRAIDLCEEYAEYDNGDNIYELRSKLEIIRSDPRYCLAAAANTDDPQLSPDSLFKSAESYIKLGDTHLSVANTEKAKENYRKAIDLLDSLLASYPDQALYLELLNTAETKLASADLPPAPAQEQKPRSLLSKLFKRKK